MLKGFQTSARPTSSALQNMLLGLMIAGCGWLGCWTVQAAPTQAAIQKQTESPASEPLRIAWKEPAAARTASYFVRPNSQPWDLLGNTNGYLSVRIAELLQHPMLKYQVPIVESLAERLLLPAEDGTAQRLADFGMSLDAVRQVDIGTSMLLSISPPNDEQRARGLHRGGISIGGATSRFRIDATRIIDWPSLARAVNFSTWYDSETCTAIAKSIELGIENGRIATTPELTMVSELEPASTPLNACQKQLWQDVHGGVVTWFTRFTAEANLQKLAESALDDPTSSVTERTWWKTAQSISSIAIGLDFTEGSEQEWLRISLEPVDGKSADTIAGELNTFRATFITETNLSQIGLSDSKRDDLIRQLRGLEISAVGSGETARVQIQGPISIATLLQINE